MERTDHLPAGMVTLGGALAGFLTELEERTGHTPAGVQHGTFGGKIEQVWAQKAPAMLSTSEGVNDYVGVANE